MFLVSKTAAVVCLVQVWAHVRALADNTILNSNVVKVEKMRFAFFGYPAKKTKPKKNRTHAQSGIPLTCKTGAAIYSVSSVCQCARADTGDLIAD